MFQNDYIMREIENLSRAVAKVFFQKDVISNEIFDQQGNISESNFLYHRLKLLIHDRRINEAEDLLFEEVEQNNSEEIIKVAIKFYQDLQELDDKTLLDCDFSQQEILEGIQAIQKISGSL